jgi:hypothetical protein
MSELENYLKTDAAQRLLDMLKTGLGAGAAYAGFRHVRNSLTDAAKDRRRQLTPQPLLMPVPMDTAPAAGLPKLALSLTDGLAATGVINTTGADRGLSGRALGDKADWLGAVPWYIAGAPVALGGAFALGKSLVGGQLDQVKRRERQAELDQVKQEYERQLGFSKASNETAELDAIWEARCELEKQSFLNESIGLAGLAALLSGAMTAYQTMGVDATKSKAKLLDRALAARQRLATGSEPLVVPQQPSPSLPDVDDDN